MEKKVELFIGVPCSGKSTHLENNYNQDEIFVISMDNIRYEYAEKTGLSYSDFFKRPSEDETVHPVFGEKTEKGNWFLIETLNDEMHKAFKNRIDQSTSALEHGKRVIVDMTNLTKSVRAGVRKWFDDVEDVKFSATIFDFEENLDLIKSQNKIRGKEQDKFIPDFVIDNMVKSYEPIELSENITEVKFVDGLKGLKEDRAYRQKSRKKAKRKMV